MPEESLGAVYLGDGRSRFRVWAPLPRRVELHLVAPQERIIPLDCDERGYCQAVVEGVEPGSLYFFRLDGAHECPDPSSRFQPEGVHGPSQVVSPEFAWQDGGWCGLPLRDYIIYELHVGTFTAQGTFEAAVGHLDELVELGVTAVELMPVAQFPGSRNWGYDGAFPFAVQNTYGGPEGLKRLVDACHRRGLAAVLDVVYNHLGPEGNYLAEFAPYFTDRYRAPWGPAINFDGPGSDEVRRFFIANALYWVSDFHFDALRIDAVHAVLDFSATPFLEELGEAVRERAERLRRRIYLIPESDLNDTRLIRPRQLGGFGLDAQWNDDFHHALHTLLTGERSGYYEDFGRLGHLAKAFREGFVYSGQYSRFRRRRHGNSSQVLPAHQFVVCSQNHDQVGNRLRGERLSGLVCPERLKLAAGAVILSPFIPLLFMGEEYGETAPFQYFISHLDPALVEAVRRGRRVEFAAFNWQADPPDPQDEATFGRAKLDRRLRQGGKQRALLEFYQELIRLRKEIPALARLSKEDMEVLEMEREGVLLIRRSAPWGEAALILHFGPAPAEVALPLPEGEWRRRLDSAEARWLGPGTGVPESLTSEGEASLSLAPYSVVLLTREEGS